MSSYKRTLQCYFKTPFTLKDTCKFQDGHYVTSFWKIPVYLQTLLSHFKIFVGDIWKNGQTFKKLTGKSCRMSLERTKISKNQVRKLTVKGGPKISFWRRTCNYTGILWNNIIKHPEIFWRFRDFSRWHRTSKCFFLLINYWCNLHILNANFQNHQFLSFFWGLFFIIF